MKSFFNTNRAAAWILALAAALLLCGCGAQPQAESMDTQDCRVLAEVWSQLAQDQTQSDVTRLQQGVIRQIADALAETGRTVCCADGNTDMENTEAVFAFFQQLEDGAQDARLSVFEVCADGGLLRHDLSVHEGQASVMRTRIAPRSGVPEVTYCEQSALTQLELTEHGYLLYVRTIADNPASQDEHDGYIEPVTMLRVRPAGDGCREISNTYLAPVGYRIAGLFDSDWSVDSLQIPDLDTLFPALYCVQFGSFSGGAVCPWPYDAASGVAFVPQETFESVICAFLALEPWQIRELGPYDATAACYHVRLNQSVLGNQRTPEPDVTSFSWSQDGHMLEICVNAVWPHYATDCAFSHVTTVRCNDDGSFQFVSNQVIARSELSPIG